jgi:phosphatidylserine/phosphatidylglycerophosphate/cardiolipin synthase-like enzyme
VGIAAQGRNLKVVLLRTSLALRSAAQKAWEEGGGAANPENPADPYMTLLGYFNSLRELGGSRRIVEDEVATRLGDYGKRRLRVGEKAGALSNRKRITALDLDERQHAVLHAKLVVIDQRRTFITSANFTEAAQQRNIEAGVLVEDRAFAERVTLQFDRLIEAGSLKRLPF